MRLRHSLRRDNMMRSILLLGATLLFTVSCGHGSEAGEATSQALPGAVSSPSGRALGVEEFMRSVDSRTGEVVVEGVVSAVSASERRIALIDTAEFEHCGVVTCAEYTLPVRWTDVLPAVKDHLRVRGSVGDDGGKLIFVAAGVEKVSAGGGER